MRQRKRTMRYAWEDHSHPELGVAAAPRSGEQESWLGTDVFRWFSWTSAPYHLQRLGLQMADSAMESCVDPDAWPEKYIRNHVRGARSGLTATWMYPYSMTNGFYFRTTFGYGGTEDLTVPPAQYTAKPYVMQGLGGSDGNPYTSRFVGAMFGEYDFNLPNQRPGVEAVFMVRNNGEETIVPALTMQNWEEGHVWVCEIETLQVNQVRVTLTDLNNGDTASHTFDSSVDAGVPDSDAFGTYADPLTLRPWFYTNKTDYNLVRWDSVESAYAPWERYEAE